MGQTQQAMEDACRACGALFYQNREQEAYRTLAALLPGLQEEMRGRLTDPDVCRDAARAAKLVGDLRELVDAYQRQDALALADLLTYDMGGDTI